MNPLTEMMIEQKTRWALPENKAEIIEDLMETIECGGRSCGSRTTCTRMAT